MKTPYTTTQSSLDPTKYQVRAADQSPILTIRPLAEAEALEDALNSAYQAGLQDQGVGVERIMEVVKQWREEDNTGSIEAVDFPDAMENADSQGWLLLSDLRTRLQALFAQTQVEPVTWSDRDIDVAYLMGVINGASHEANGKTPWPSLDRVVQELERTKGQSAMIRDAVRSFKVPAKAIAADTPQSEGRDGKSDEPCNHPQEYHRAGHHADQPFHCGLCGEDL